MPKFEAPDYLRLLNGGTRYRMMRLRDRVVQSQNKPQSLQIADWRKARACGFHNWEAAYCALDQGEQNGDKVWYTHCGEYFRNERFADEIVRNLPRGWYTNHYGTTYKDGSGLARGIVASLPHGRFIAGYWFGDNGERVWFDEVFTDEDDAAQRADSHAERFAEMCREDSERFANMQLAEFDVEEKTNALQESIALRHHTKFGGFARVRRDIERLRKAWESLTEATRVYEGQA